MPLKSTPMPALTKEPLTSTEPRIKPYRVAEVAGLLGVHPVTIYRDIQCGRLRAYRVGSGKGALRIFPAAYDAYLALLEVRAVASVEVA